MTTSTPTATVALPQLSGGRSRADALVAASLPADLAGHQVTVDARQLVAGSEAFADELVHQVLQIRAADVMHVVNVGDDFAGYLERAAKERGLSARLRVARLL